VASRGRDDSTLCRQRGIVGVVDRVAGSTKLRAAAVLLLLVALLPLSFFLLLSLSALFVAAAKGRNSPQLGFGGCGEGVL